MKIPLVSICCITYNHENYITDAIESFLMQKANFDFEIIIHDDASTDNTAEVIREYEKKYPGIIKPIYQTENQYSKGIKVLTLCYARAQGKYIALCEGDDYWIDANKLQKQVDFMETHPEYSLCTHAARVVNYDKGSTNINQGPNQGSKTYFVEDVIMGEGAFFATNSMLFKKESVQHMPDFYYAAPVGDYPLTIYLALQGTVFYIDEFMSARRTNIKGSWTYMIQHSEQRVAKTIDHNEKIKNMLLDINEYTSQKYSVTIKDRISANDFNVLVLNEDFKGMRHHDYYNRYYNNLGVKEKISLYLQEYLPLIYPVICKVYRILIGDRLARPVN